MIDPRDVIDDSNPDDQVTSIERSPSATRFLRRRARRLLASLADRTTIGKSKDERRSTNGNYLAGISCNSNFARLYIPWPLEFWFHDDEPHWRTDQGAA